MREVVRIGFREDQDILSDNKIVEEAQSVFLDQDQHHTFLKPFAAAGIAAERTFIKSIGFIRIDRDGEVPAEALVFIRIGPGNRFDLFPRGIFHDLKKRTESR